MGCEISYVHPDNKQCNIAYVKIKIGSYTGNEVDNRDIDIGVNLLLKNQAFVFIKNTDVDASPWRSNIHSGDIASYFMNTADDTNVIQAFTSTGFQIGTGVPSNRSGKVYRYVAIWEEP